VAIMDLKEKTGFSHRKFLDLFNRIVNETRNLNSFSQWIKRISEILNQWKAKVRKKTIYIMATVLRLWIKKLMRELLI